MAVVAAGAATLLLRPRDGLIEPAAVNATAYFSAAELERASDFRDLQRILGLAGTTLAGLTVAASRSPAATLRTAIERLQRRPLLGAAALAAGIAVTVAVVELPLSIWRHERAVDFGLSTQSFGPWLADVAKATAIGAVYAAVAGLLAMALIRRFPRNWWAPGAVLVVAAATVMLYLQPIVVDPLFNRFEPLARGAAQRGAATSPTAPGSTSARSTASTPAAARTRSTPMSAASATPSASSSTTT